MSYNCGEPRRELHDIYCNGQDDEILIINFTTGALK